MCARVAAPVEPKPARFVKVTTVTADVSPDDEAAWDAMECGAVREGLLPLRLARVSGDGVKEEVFLELTDGTRLPVMVAR
jgi:hypothetical protein